MAHSPARWLPYGRPETSRLFKVDTIYVARAHNNALGRIRVIASGYRRSGGQGGGQEFRPGSVTRGMACLTSVCVYKTI
jgi:hypothetical protein